MKIKTAFLVSFIFAFAFCVQAQLSFKNSTSKPISVAIGWYSEGNDYTGYVTKGWYSIEPGETINPGLTFTSNDDFFFYYVKGFGGDNELLVADDAFEIKNANLQYVQDANPQYNWVKFKRVDVHFMLLEPKKKTITFYGTSN